MLPASTAPWYSPLDSSPDGRPGRAMSKQLCAVVFLALVVRAIVVAANLTHLDALAHPVHYKPDSYMVMAEAWERTGVHQYPVYPPIYPYLCLLARRLAGPLHAYTIMLLLNVVAGTVSVALAYKVAQQIGLSPRQAFIASALLALEPLNVVITGFVLSETLYVMMLLLALHLTLAAGRPVQWAVSGLAWGINSLVRGIGSFAMAGSAIYVLLRKRKTSALAILVLCTALPLLVWSGYNYHHYGFFAPGTTVTFNLAVAWAGIAKHRAQNTWMGGGMIEWKEQMGKDWHEPNPFRKAQKAALIATRWMLHHPADVAKALLISIAYFWAGVMHGAWRVVLGPLYGPTSLAVILITRSLYNALGLIGVVVGLKRRQPWVLLPVIMILCHEIPVGCAGEGRYAVPATVFVCMLAAGGIQALQRIRAEV